MIGLTARQQDALRYISGHIEAEGMAPTYEQIAAGMGLARKSTAHRLVVALEERGALSRDWRPRSIALVEPVSIPRAPDGAPLFFVRIPQSQGGTE